MNLNKVFIVGRLTADPQIRSTASGQQVLSIGVATNRVWYDKNKVKQEAADFHNVVIWGKQAEVVSKFLTKGSLIFVEGRLQTRSWTDKQGQSRRTTEVIAERIQLGPKAGAPRRGEAAPSASAPAPASDKENNPEVPIINVEDEIKPEDLDF